MKICIYGAGSIGCYLGGRLIAAGYDINFIVRPKIQQALQTYGLTVSDYTGFKQTISVNQLQMSIDHNVAAHADIVFVCVKSTSTEQVALELKDILKKKTIIISFQNGLSNVGILKRILTDHIILEGMVPFNVAALGNGRFHQGTDGALYVKKHEQLTELVLAFQKAKLEFQLEQDMQAVQWAKLLLNLNNSINALSQLPLKQELSIREYRQCLALAQLETLNLLKIAKIKPAKLTPIPAQFIPKILKLPNPIFKIISKKMLAIDPLARSSMADDLMVGRKTEIDCINGEVVNLARQLNLTVPINQKLIELVKQAESEPKVWSGSKLKAQLTQL
ncbi:2-dehydropantoate 2-reductase [Acinetobacter junii]|uniref:2-dehydropantoate 2-reductase n=1 Tax=Acinetobacter junii TaxID=40215 RepID=UPI0010AA027A|nr:2-dehydropantoate 2-reductase [Acinetobacter junii]MCU4407258.1 2-dehydropantoate 2-reductase [Acinetobacter junii]MDU2407557.1 2-dehydropantoate 2-reductase [Acinetobacter junii]MEB8381215.1 2-dehydropantoate 2-reductase [Acinetobacter junii]TID63745.1 2-dehydropantoate 2-reductase [Acinetobacter junii]